MRKLLHTPLFWTNLFALVLLGVIVGRAVLGFNPPSQSAGQGSGALAVDADQNLSIFSDTLSGKSATIEGAANQLVVDGAAMVSDKLGVGVNPDQKVKIAGGNLWQTAGTPKAESAVNVGALVTAIAVSGRYAYLGTSNGSSGSVLIYDISNPASPVSAGGYQSSNLERITALTIAGNYVYAGTKGSSDACPASLSASSDLLKCELIVLDISNPKNPTLVGWAEIGSSVNDIAISGRYVYLAIDVSDSKGMKVFDVSNPTNPSFVGGADLGTGGENGYAIFVSGKYAYVGNNDGVSSKLFIYDVSNPGSPLFSGSVSTNAAVYDIAVSGMYAYVGLAADGNGVGFKIYDVSSKFFPTLKGGVITGTDVFAIAVAGRYAYLGTGAGTGWEFRVVGVSDPESPTEIAGIDQTYSVSSLVVAGKYAYFGLGSGNNIFVPVDISGAYLPTADIGSLVTNFLSVADSVRIGNGLYVESGLNVGSRGIMSGGDVSVLGDVTISSDDQTISGGVSLYVIKTAGGAGTTCSSLCGGSANSCLAVFKGDGDPLPCSGTNIDANRRCLCVKLAN